jgi:hypothetical protein
MATDEKETKTPDAVALLKADHRQIKEWFAKFEDVNSSKVKQKLATDICNALKVHTQIEEEIFYPAFLNATKDKDMHHQAEVEHSCAKTLIAEIEDSVITDEYFDSKMHVLAEMIKHHVKEEEQADGMFTEAENSDLDLSSLGAQLFKRKQELTAEVEGK